MSRKQARARVYEASAMVDAQGYFNASPIWQRDEPIIQAMIRRDISRVSQTGSYKKAN